MLRAASRVLALMAGSAYAIPACAPGKPCDSTTEVLDSVTMSNVVCGGYGDPHIARPDGKLVNHMGQGEYQLLSLPALSTDIHYCASCLFVTHRQTRHPADPPPDSVLFRDGPENSQRIAREGPLARVLTGLCRLPLLPAQSAAASRSTSGAPPTSRRARTWARSPSRSATRRSYAAALRGADHGLPPQLHSSQPVPCCCSCASPPHPPRIVWEQEIVGNDLSVVGGASYSIDWHKDKAMGPFEVAAGASPTTLPLPHLHSPPPSRLHAPPPSLTPPSLLTHHCLQAASTRHWLHIGSHPHAPLTPHFAHRTRAGATTVTIAREAITTLDLHKAQWRDALKEGLGHFLYRWTVSTPEGLQVHSHAVPVPVAQGEWVLDVHVNCAPPEAPVRGSNPRLEHQWRPYATPGPRPAAHSFRALCVAAPE